jgi:hypothetical protein
MGRIITPVLQECEELAELVAQMTVQLVCDKGFYTRSAVGPAVSLRDPFTVTRSFGSNAKEYRFGCGAAHGATSKERMCLVASESLLAARVESFSE